MFRLTSGSHCFRATSIGISCGPPLSVKGPGDAQPVQLTLLVVPLGNPLLEVSPSLIHVAHTQTPMFLYGSTDEKIPGIHTLLATCALLSETFKQYQRKGNTSSI